MSSNTNKVNITGDVSGNVVAGMGNVVGDMWVSPQPQERRPRLGPNLEPRLGFKVDVVGYGARSGPLREDIAYRLSVLVTGLLADIGFDLDDTDNDGGAGDGMAVFLPAGTDPTRALSGLLSATTARLALDNARYRDRMRVRMAIGSGLVGGGPTGFTGALIVDLSRLVDSDPLRAAVLRHEYADAVVLVANTLHDEVVRPGYLPPALNTFQQVNVTVKEFSGTAWLWLSTMD
jgi:hypothetical protein